MSDQTNTTVLRRCVWAPSTLPLSASVARNVEENGSMILAKPPKLSKFEDIPPGRFQRIDFCLYLTAVFYADVLTVKLRFQKRSAGQMPCQGARGIYQGSCFGYFGSNCPLLHFWHFCLFFHHSIPKEVCLMNCEIREGACPARSI